MNTSHHDYYEREKLKEAYRECKNDSNLEFEITGEDIQYNLDECYEAAKAYIN